MLYPLRASLTAIWFFSGSFILFVLSLFRPFNPANGTLFGRLVSPVVLKILNLKVTIRHGERLKGSQPCIFISNHQSVVDLFVFSYILPSKTITIGKKSIRWVPLFGWLYWLAGHVL